jgi:hypothetical protein
LYGAYVGIRAGLCPSADSLLLQARKYRHTLFSYVLGDLVPIEFNVTFFSQDDYFQVIRDKEQFLKPFDLSKFVDENAVKESLIE